MKQYNFKKGRGGEERAKIYLEGKGWQFVEANYKNKIGEIDLIMVDDNFLVFVEVKYKEDDSFGTPEEMINSGKLWQVRKVAESYLVVKKDMTKQYQKYRIDAVCIVGDEIKHYKNLY